MPADFHIGQPRGQAAADPYHIDTSLDKPFDAPMYSLKWWFNYFWEECTSQQRDSYYRQLFEPNGDEKRQSDWDKREILTAMLKDGFEEFSQIGNYLRTEDIAFPVIRGTDLHVGYRGDSRVPREVEVQRGTIAKVRVPALRQLMHMRELWNPFSDPAMKGKVYFRKGNKDNCLQTVVSVAVEFNDATKFPLFQEMAQSKIGTAVVEVGFLQADGVTERPGPPVPKILKASRTNLYVLKTGDVYDTQKRQQDTWAPTFLERGVGEIPWSRHLARIRVDRIHYGDDANKGHLAIVRGIDWLQNRAMLCDLLRGSANVNGLDSYLNEEFMMQNGGLHHCMPREGGQAEIKIKKVVTIDIPGSWW